MTFNEQVQRLLEAFDGLAPYLSPKPKAAKSGMNNGPTTGDMSTKGVAGFPNQGVQNVSITLPTEKDLKNFPRKNKPRSRRKLRNKVVG